MWSQLSDMPGSVRALSVLPGIATVPAIYFAGKTLFSRWGGIISALLLSVTVFHIMYSQQARSYSLLVLLVTCSCLLFAQTVRGTNRCSELSYVLISAAALYTHFFAALVVLAQFAWWMSLASRLRTWNPPRNMFLVAVMGLPLLLFIASRGASHLDWVQPTPHLVKDLFHLFTSFSGSGLKFGIFLLATALAVREWWSQRSLHNGTSKADSFTFVVLWLLLPLAVTLVASHWKPMFVARFLIISLPAALLLFGQGLALIRPRWLCFTAVGVVALASLIAVRSYYRQPGESDWKSAVSYLAQNARSGDVLIFANPYCRFPFDYNLRTSGIKLPSMRIESGSTIEARQYATQPEHFWVIDFPAHPLKQSLPRVESNGPARAPRIYRLHTVEFPGVVIQEFESK
jgi:mannosyltransferase